MASKSALNFFRGGSSSIVSGTTKEWGAVSRSVPTLRLSLALTGVGGWTVVSRCETRKG